MPATPLAVTDLSRSGVVPTLAAANIDGHFLPNTGREFLMIANGGAVSLTVSAVITRLVDGVTPAAKQITIAAGVTKLFGPFSKEDYNDVSAQVAITFGAVTSVTIQALRLTAAV